MTTETWIIIILAAGANMGGIMSAYISFATRLTRIEDDLKWLRSNCPQCQRSLETLSK